MREISEIKKNSAMLGLDAKLRQNVGYAFFKIIDINDVVQCVRIQSNAEMTPFRQQNLSRGEPIRGSVPSIVSNDGIHLNPQAF